MMKQDGLSNHIQGAANRGQAWSRAKSGSIRKHLPQALAASICGVSIDNESDQAS
jgi:hypothetical protein